MSQQFDTVVIGAGPGGYVAAIRAAQLGQKVAIIEKEHLGGICLNWGCIPTKALLKASETYATIQHAADFGIHVKGEVEVNIKELVQRSRGVANTLSGGIGFLMKKNGIETLMGSAKFVSKSEIEVTDKDGKTQSVTANNFVIATGARPRQIPGVLEADGKNIWTYYEAMVPEKLPKSLLVIGAGAIGIEFASFYATFGVEVTVVEGLDRVLPVEDAEVSKMLEKSLKKRGIKIMTGAKVQGLKSNKSDVSATIENSKGKEEKIKFDKAILAIGVQGNVESLGLEALAVEHDRGIIAVDTQYRTNVPGIWAIGDIVGRQALAHVASHEGVICAEAIGKYNHTHEMDYDNVPGCTYCTPQVASTGFTEERAKAEGHNIKVGKFMYQANGKAKAIGEEEGMVKTIFDKDSGELLGAHIIGAEATEMISTFVLGKQLETTEEDLIATCFPHPTLSEMLHESVLDAEGRTLNS